MENVKKHILSVLTSTPSTVSMAQLDRDYKELLGNPIPYQSLGYNSLEHFLKSIPDTVQVKGNGPTATVLPKVSEKVAHIHQLVTSQRTCRKKNKNRTAFPVQKRYNKDSSNNTHRFCPTSESGWTGGSNAINIDSNYSDDSKLNAKKSSSIKSESNFHKNSSFTNKSLKTVSNRSPEINPGINTKTDIDHTKSTEVNNRFKVIDNVCNSNEQNKLNTRNKCTTTLLGKIYDTHSVEDAIPLNIRMNLKTLISKYPNGIWCSRLPKIYSAMFNTKLDYEGLGYSSLSHLCILLPSIFHCSRPSQGDYLLFDKSKRFPASIDGTSAATSCTLGNKNTLKCKIDKSCIDWCDVEAFIPEEVFKPGHEIPRDFVSPETREEDVLKIVVSEVYSPSKFWAFKDNSQLDSLVDEMQDFYKANFEQFLIPDDLLKDGIYCTQIIYGEYHRAFIVDILPESSDTMKVLFIDYGTMTKVSRKGACYLHKRFSTLPAQAIRCYLADICPLKESHNWNKETSVAFRSLVKNRTIEARIAKINWKDSTLGVYLIDVTDPKNKVNINSKLVEKGFARYAQ